MSESQPSGYSESTDTADTDENLIDGRTGDDVSDKGAAVDIQCTPSGSSSARAPSIASHRSRYSARIERRWPRQSYSVRYAVTSIWVSGDGHSTTASQAR